VHPIILRRSWYPQRDITPDAQRSAALLRLMIQAMIVLSFVSIAVPVILGAVPIEFTEYEAALVIFNTICLVLLRFLPRIGYRAAAWVWIIFICLIIVWIAYPNKTLDELGMLSFFVLPLMLTNLFLDNRANLIIAGFSLALMIGLIVIVPEAPIGQLFEGPGALLVIITGLMLLARRHGDQIESDRRDDAIAAEKLRAALDKQRAVNDLKSHLMRTVSHEFRNPLAAIRSSADLLHSYHLRMTEPQREAHFDTIFDQIARLTEMIDDITVLTKLQAENAPLNAQSFDVAALCMALLDEYRRRIASDHVYTLKIADAGDAEGLRAVNGDKGLLRMILDNLISNAAKYSPPGSDIALEVARQQEWLVFLVSDHGSGIALDDQARLYDEFFRGHNVGEQPGSGLGLKIVQDCVRLYNGSVSFSSVVGAGTTFTVRLPILHPTFNRMTNTISAS